MSETRFKEAAEKAYDAICSDVFKHTGGAKSTLAQIAEEAVKRAYTQGREDMKSTCAEFERVAQDWKRRAEAAEARVKELESSGATLFLNQQILELRAQRAALTDRVKELEGALEWIQKNAKDVGLDGYEQRARQALGRRG